MFKIIWLMFLLSSMFNIQNAYAREDNGQLEVTQEVVEQKAPEVVSRFQIDSTYRSEFFNKAADYFDLDLNALKYEKFEEHQWESYVYENQERIINISSVYNLLSVTYTQNNQMHYDVIAGYLKELELFTMDGLFYNNELDFLSVDEVKNQAETFLNHFNLNLDYQLNIYGVKNSDISQLLETPEGRAILEYNKNSQPEQSTIEPIDFSEFYYVTCQFYLNNIPLNQVNLGDQERGVVANVMDFSMIITKSGPTSIALQGVVQPRPLNDQIKILGTKEVIEKLEKKYDNIILLEPVKLTKLELVYVPYVSLEPDRELVPTWQGAVLQESELEEGHEIFEMPVFFDAITGDEVSF